MAVENQNIDRIPQLVATAAQLLMECDQLELQSAKLAGHTPLNVEQERIQSQQRADFLLKTSNISGVAIMTDSDDTGEKATTFYGDIIFHK